MIFFEPLFRLTGFAVLFLCALNFGALSAEDEEAPWPDGHRLNEIPMFGEGRLPERLQKANRKLVREAYKTGISLTKSSNHAMERGWKAFNSSDTATAIRQFNQAWLLDRRNGAVYWGFGVVLYKRDGDLKGALKMFGRARRMQPDNPYLLVDYGRVFEENGEPDAAVTLFLDAVSLDPDTKYAYVGLVRAYVKANDLDNALLFAYEGKDRGDPISDEFIAALEKIPSTDNGLPADVKLTALPEWRP